MWTREQGHGCWCDFPSENQQDSSRPGPGLGVQEPDGQSSRVDLEGSLQPSTDRARKAESLVKAPWFSGVLQRNLKASQSRILQSDKTKMDVFGVHLVETRFNSTAKTVYQCKPTNRALGFTSVHQIR